MSTRTTRQIALALTTVACVGLGAFGWIWVHRKADHELIEALEEAKLHLPPGTELIWGKAVALPASHGARLQDVTIRDEGETLTAGMLEILGVSSVTPDRAQAAGSTGAGPLHCEHVIFYRLHTEGKTGRSDIRRLALDGLQLPAATSDQLPGLVLDHAEFDDAHAVSADGLVTGTVRHGILNQFGGEHISRLILEEGTAQDTDPPARTLSFGKFMLDGTDLAAAHRAWMAGESLVQDGNASMTVEKLEIQGSADASAARQVPLWGVGAVHLHADTAAQKSRITESLTDLHIWPNGPQTSLIKTLGYDRFKGDVVLNAIVDLDLNVAHVTQLDIHAPQWGRLDLAGDFLNVAVPLGQIPTPQVSHLDISWRDDGLVSRILNDVAVTQGMDPDAYVTLLRRSLTRPGASVDSPGVQLATYLRQPDAGPLTIMVAPPEPVPLVSLLAVATLPTHPEVARTLGLTIQAPTGEGPATGSQTGDNPDMTTDEPTDPSILAPPSPQSAPQPSGTAH